MIRTRLERTSSRRYYKCYLRFIEVLRPTAFVMENVKGLLSARNYGEGVFGHIRADMEALGYELHSMVVKDPERLMISLFAPTNSASPRPVIGSSCSVPGAGAARALPE